EGSERKAQLIGTEFFSRLPTLAEVAKLCHTLQREADARVGELQARNFKGKLPKQDGEYPLNVFDEKGPFLLPKASDSLKDFSATHDPDLEKTRIMNGDKTMNVPWAIAYAAFISLSGFVVCWLLGNANIGPSIIVGLLVGSLYLIVMLLGIIQEMR